MSARPGLSLERHREIGARLKAIRDELVSLHVEIGGAYGVSRAVVMLATKAREALDRLRGELESRGFAQHGDAFDVHVYYPPANDVGKDRAS